MTGALRDWGLGLGLTDTVLLVAARRSLWSMKSPVCGCWVTCAETRVTCALCTVRAGAHEPSVLGAGQTLTDMTSMTNMTNMMGSMPGLGRAPTSFADQPGGMGAVGSGMGPPGMGHMDMDGSAMYDPVSEEDSRFDGGGRPEQMTAFGQGLLETGTRLDRQCREWAHSAGREIGGVQPPPCHDG
jgi:hypothetical protein